MIIESFHAGLSIVEAVCLHGIVELLLMLLNQIDRGYFGGCQIIELSQVDKIAFPSKFNSNSMHQSNKMKKQAYTC